MRLHSGQVQKMHPILMNVQVSFSDVWSDGSESVSFNGMVGLKSQNWFLIRVFFFLLQRNKRC